MAQPLPQVYVPYPHGPCCIYLLATHPHSHSVSALHQRGLDRILISCAAMPPLHAFVPCPAYSPARALSVLHRSSCCSSSQPQLRTCRLSPHATCITFLIPQWQLFIPSQLRQIPRSNAQHELSLSCIYFCVHDFLEHVGKFCEIQFSCKNVMIFAKRCSIIDHV